MRIVSATLLVCLVCAGSACFFAPRFLTPRDYYVVYSVEATPVPSSTVRSEFELEGVEILWRGSNLFIEATILNNTDRLLTIHWANSSILYESESESIVARVGYLKEGVAHTLDEPGEQQAPSYLAPSGRASFIVLPRSHARWQPFTRSTKGFWTVAEPLWGVNPVRSQTKEETQAMADSVVDRTVRVSLALEHSGDAGIVVNELRLAEATVTRVNW